MTENGEKVPGHTPAAKVGGMRVAATGHSPSEEAAKAPGPLNSVTTAGADAALAMAGQKSAVQAAIARDHHEESVKHKHSKPQPTVEKSHHNMPKTHIHQPSKQ